MKKSVDTKTISEKTKLLKKQIGMSPKARLEIVFQGIIDKPFVNACREEYLMCFTLTLPKEKELRWHLTEIAYCMLGMNKFFKNESCILMRRFHLLSMPQDGLDDMKKQAEELANFCLENND